MTRASVRNAPISDQAQGSPAAPGPAAVTALPPLPVFDVSGREEAYDALERIADYLTLLEPHSPAPFLVRRAVAWGRMPLPRLLAELMAEHGDLQRVFIMLGIEQERHGQD
jgi:type VI secretion system protein ImpA